MVEHHQTQAVQQNQAQPDHQHPTQPDVSKRFIET